MKEYKIRIYRDNFNRDRWQTFTISYKESDLCIGIDTASYVPEMNLFAGQILRELRLEMDAYITNDPTYAVILSPYFPAAGAPGILVRSGDLPLGHRDQRRQQHRAGQRQVIGAAAGHLGKIGSVF